MPQQGLVRACVRRRRREGFTLVELLVVIGIITLLIGMLLPTLVRSRYEAQVTTCAARLQQLAASFNTYAAENRGRMPRFDVTFASPAAAPNLWDVSTQFYDVFRTQYGVPHRALFCPLSDDRLVDSAWRDGMPERFYRLGYALWIPRVHGDAMLPPLPGDPTATVFTPIELNLAREQGIPLEKESCCGPARQGDAYANRTPILTDVIFSQAFNADLLACVDASKVAVSDLWPGAQHVLHRRVHSINAAYADGHVVRLRPDEVRPRFLSRGNNWNWY